MKDYQAQDKQTSSPPDRMFSFEKNEITFLSFFRAMLASRVRIPNPETQLIQEDWFINIYLIIFYFRYTHHGDMPVPRNSKNLECKAEKSATE